MVSLRTLRDRIKAIKNTEKITNAMKMISAVKYRKSQELYKKYSIYYKEMKHLFVDLINNGNIDNISDFFLFKNNKALNKCYIIISSDKGLCGSYNSNIIKKKNEIFKNINREKTHVFFLGKKAFDHMKKENFYTRGKHFELETLIKKREVYDIIDDIMNFIINNEYKEVHIIYSKFKSVSVQEFVCEKIFPIDNFDEEYFYEEKTKSEAFNYEEKNVSLIFNFFKSFFISKFYNVILSSLLSEHSFRMRAMENANKNSKEIIDKLVLLYNRSRQTIITTELIEIISGSELS